ncbi:hypothetical protein [Streptosporangium amethystogenes]|uniref:hypothetical protein n=1 Tax=Streptosporangium amethystogenes TaxID=2002 RepID=UPI0004CA2378|nr:hypothetical protein [Streptosporangium amethystogenes]
MGGAHPPTPDPDDQRRHYRELGRDQPTVRYRPPKTPIAVAWASIGPVDATRMVIDGASPHSVEAAVKAAKVFHPHSNHSASRRRPKTVQSPRA